MATALSIFAKKRGQNETIRIFLMELGNEEKTDNVTYNSWNNDKCNNSW